MSRYIKSNGDWHHIKNYYLKQNNSWVSITEEQFAQIFIPQTFSYSGEVEPIGILEIGGIDVVEATSCSYTAILNSTHNVTSAATWTLEYDGEEPAIINSAGTVTILQWAYNVPVTVKAEYGSLMATKDVVLTYQTGTTATTETESYVDESGNTATNTITVITNEDGTSETISTGVLTDESGNTISSNESVINVNSDGSSTSTSTNYDANGNPTSTTNKSGDTAGNIEVQGIGYDENGDPIVTGYTIDTSENPDGSKQYNGDGVNTDYYAFDVTDGFELKMHFTIDFSNQPPGQNQNHHNILTMKRADPEPWYGFQLRQSSTNRYIQLGTQFSGGSNTNTTISAATIVNNVGEYDLTITYDPTLTANTFVCYDEIKEQVVFSSNRLFPDIPELEYLKVVIGYSLDSNGDPYRYSNINVLNFSIEKLSAAPIPSISCDGMEVAITCQDTGATLYYRLNQTGVYVEYANEIPITANTIVEAYSELNGKMSTIITKTCVFDNGVAEPVITCDGANVTITCDTPGADIYFRLNETGDFSLYEVPIEITATTVVEAYATIDGRTSQTVKETCQYEGAVKKPVILCTDEKTVTLICDTAGADIYCRVNQEGNYALYTSPIIMSANTFIEAYSVYDVYQSAVVSQTCYYNPNHNYANDYLTFRIISGGTINWAKFGSGSNNAIVYSINDSNRWTTITADTTPATFNVSANDIVRLKGVNTRYASSKNDYDSFSGSTAIFDAEGNIMSIIHGDNFTGNTTLSSTYNFCQLFKSTKIVSAGNLILPTLTLTNDCYRAMFSTCTMLEVAPQLPATTLATECYWYMFEACAITEAPELLAETLKKGCYGHMFVGCSNLNYIKCLATDISASACTVTWVGKKNAETTIGVAAVGTFVKHKDTTWTLNSTGIPPAWEIQNEGAIKNPVIYCDGEEVEITCETTGTSIYYRLDETGDFALYSAVIPITADTIVEAYSMLDELVSSTVTQNCIYYHESAYEASNKSLTSWKYGVQQIETPYSVNAIDGHSSKYEKGTFTFETEVGLRKTQPTYLWFQHADQSATIYVDNTLVEKHWGGYNAFFVDISNYAHKGVNNIKVILNNNEGSNLAPAAGDFNFNATLGNVKLLTSPVLPAMKYGYDGFHITSNVDLALSSATINVKTTIPTGATVVCTIDDGTYNYSTSGNSTGEEMTFTTTINNVHLWNGLSDPHLYTVTLEIYKDGELYHSFERPYGFRHYDYVFNQQISGETYTGFLLNGSPYLLRGVCMHDDVEGKANALSATDIAHEFNIIQELGCNFLRLAHYPHPKEVYDWCDQLGIIVQTEVPCVNKLQSTMPADYYTHLTDQYKDMVEQHYNHPCILFWGLSNETTTDDKDFGKDKIEEYTALIRSMDSERWVGYVMSHSYNNPSAYYNNPDVDWFGCNIYTGWYVDKNSNDPTGQLNTRVNNTIVTLQKPLAFSEYGAGGTQRCHSEDPQNTTTKGTNQPRHDIEYQMWIHEGHIAAIRNFPQLLFTAEWQLFDIAVYNRQEGYVICLDGENTSEDNNLKYLNNKGLVERDHYTKKDTFYLYKAEWNPEKFVHICGKDYTKTNDRTIKCYTTETGTLSMYVDNSFVDTASVVDHIATFSSRAFNPGSTIVVSGDTSSDTFEIAPTS